MMVGVVTQRPHNSSVMPEFLIRAYTSPCCDKLGWDAVDWYMG